MLNDMLVITQMKETKSGTRTDRSSKSPSTDSYPLVLDIDDFKVMHQLFFSKCACAPLIDLHMHLIVDVTCFLYHAG